MLRGLKSLLGYTLEASDGRVGTVTDFYFEDGTWRLKYAVVDAGVFIPERRALVEAGQLDSLDWNTETAAISCSLEEIRRQPEPGAQSEDLPPEATVGPVHWLPAQVTPGDVVLPYTLLHAARDPNTPNLLSFRGLLGHRVRATDGDFGRVENFIMDDETCRVCLAVIDTGSWLPGRRVFVVTDRIGEVNLENRHIYFALPRKVIEDAPSLEEKPVFDPAKPARLDAERVLFDYYGYQQPSTDLERGERVPVAEDREYRALHSRNRHKKVE